MTWLLHGSDWVGCVVGIEAINVVWPSKESIPSIDRIVLIELGQLDCGDMESLNSESKTWVFKMPNYIAEAWRKVEGRELGRLTVVESPGEKPKVSLRLTGAYAESLPKNYEMQMEENTALQVFRAKAGTASMSVSKNEPLVITERFARDAVFFSFEKVTSIARFELPKWDAGVQFSSVKTRLNTFCCFESMGLTGSEGKVDCKMDARVVAMTVGADGKSCMDGHFLRITKQKSDEEKQKRKANTIQYLEPQQGGRIIRPLPKTTNFKRKADKEQSVKLKRSRMERDDLEKELFSLFEQERYWRFAELQGKLNQPGPWLKEVVNEIAVLNKIGPNLGKYELKAEYQVDQ